jgi:hypothetical protein
MDDNSLFHLLQSNRYCNNICKSEILFCAGRSFSQKYFFFYPVTIQHDDEIDQIFASGWTDTPKARWRCGTAAGGST